jgi:hypothetical protein
MMNQNKFNINKNYYLNLKEGLEKDVLLLLYNLK